MSRPRKTLRLMTLAALLLAAPAAGFAASDDPGSAAEAQARAEARARAERIDAQTRQRNDLDAAVQRQRQSLSDQQRTNDRIGGSLDRLGADTDARMRSLRP